jgi:hypothetical protein
MKTWVLYMLLLYAAFFNCCQDGNADKVYVWPLWCLAVLGCKKVGG